MQFGDGTRCVHGGHPAPEPGAPLQPGPVFAAPYHLGGGDFYGRAGNPSWRALETAIGDLDGGRCVLLPSGMAVGLGYGGNTMSTLITRGLAETSRLGVAIGAEAMTFAGLAGLGDLVATCSSPLSRNRTFGERLGRGETLAQAQEAAHGQVAEGVKSCSSIRQLAARNGVEMPITDVVHRVCHEGLEPGPAAAALLGRERKAE